MATYKEIQAQIAELEKQAEIARRKEIEDALLQIKNLMTDFNITVADLRTTKKATKSTTKKTASTVRYRDDQGHEWSGRGREPNWLKGKDREKFVVE